MSQPERLYWIDAQIRASRYPNAETVSQRFEVSRRTAYQDRDILLHRLNAPLVFDRAHGGWAYSEPTYVLPFLALAEREASALRRTLLVAQEYLGTEDAAALQAVAERLSAEAPIAPGTGHEQARGAIRLTHRLSTELFADCERAIQSRRRLHLLYYSPRRDEVNERTIQPYEQLYWRGEPHLIAFCEWRQAIRQFFLGRIRQWSLLESEMAFARDPAFDMQAYLKRGLEALHGAELVTVKVRFSPYQARWIRERRYHESQRMEEQADGGLLLTLEVAGTEEARRWLLGYGGEAEILEPLALRREIEEEIKKLRKMYGVNAE